MNTSLGIGIATTLTVILGPAALTSCDQPTPPPAPPGATQPPPIAEPAPTPTRPTGGLGALSTRQKAAATGTTYAPLTSPPADARVADFVGLRGSTDPTWRWEPPKNAMRVINWKVPGTDGEEPAELVIMQFPEAAGNTRDANIDRWSRQFYSGDLPTQADVSDLTVATMPVTLVELQGEYLGMGGGWHKENYTMLVAMVEAPVGSVFIKLLGPTETIDQNRDAYMALVEGLHAVKTN